MHSGRLAPSVMTAGTVWGPGPEGASSWDLPPLSQDLDLRRWKLCLGTPPFLVRTENLFGGGLQGRCYMTMTWSQEQRIWHQEVCNNSPCPSLTFPRKGLCWKLSGSFGFLRHKSLSSCMALSKPLSAPNPDVLVMISFTVCWAHELVFQ